MVTLSSIVDYVLDVKKTILMLYMACWIKNEVSQISARHQSNVKNKEYRVARHYLNDYTR
jgi:hypothetical protein